jgi:hypothetical protein
MLFSIRTMCSSSQKGKHEAIASSKTWKRLARTRADEHRVWEIHGTHHASKKNSRGKNNLVGRCFADQKKRASLHASISASSSPKQLIRTVSIRASGNKIIDCNEPRYVRVG